MHRTWIAIALAGCSCGQGMGTRDAAVDARAGDGGFECPSDLAAAVDTPCLRTGEMCETPSCATSTCDPQCVRITCGVGVGGVRWRRPTPEVCADGGTDAGPPAPCTPLAADRDSTLRDRGPVVGAPTIVWEGSRYAVAWESLESTTPNPLFGAYFALAAADGTLIPGSAHRIFPAEEHQLSGALAVGDGELGFAYVHSENDGLTVNMRVHFARLDLDGALIAGSDRTMAELHPPQLAASLAYDPIDAQWAVVWQGDIPLGGGFIETHAYLSRFDASGALLTPDAVQIDALTSTTSPEESSCFVWAGDRYAIALAEYQSSTSARVSVAEIDGAGTVTRRIVMRDGGQPLRTTLATDGQLYGAAWMEIDNADPSRNAVAFRRAMVGGDALGTDPLIFGDDRSSGEPSIAFDGRTFRVAQDEVDGSTGGVWLTRIARDGTVLGTPGIAFATTPPYGAFPQIASDGCNDAVAWYSVYDGPMQQSELRLTVLAGSASGP